MKRLNLYSSYSLTPFSQGNRKNKEGDNENRKRQKVVQASSVPKLNFDSAGDDYHTDYSTNTDSKGEEYGTFVSCVLPASLLPRRGPYDTDMRILTQNEQESFWLVGLPISMEHNWGLNKEGRFNLDDPTVGEYNPERGGSSNTGDIKVGEVVDQWIAENGSIMTRNKFLLDDPDHRIRVFANGAHELVQRGYYPEVSLTHVTDAYPSGLQDGDYLIHTPIELTVTRAGYRSIQNGFSDNCRIYGVDGRDDTPTHLEKPLQRKVKDVCLAYTAVPVSLDVSVSACNSNNQNDRNSYKRKLAQLSRQRTQKNSSKNSSSRVNREAYGFRPYPQKLLSLGYL